MKIYLSPSLQDYNFGVGNYGTEKRRMFELAEILKAQLEDCGHVVYCSNPSMTLGQAIYDSNELNVDYHIALHSNAFNGNVRGCEIYCFKYGIKGEELANAIYNQLIKITPTKGRGVKEGNKLIEINSTKAPAILIEVGFHDNIEDANWIINYMVQIAVSIMNGINEIAGIPIVNDEINYKLMYENLLKKYYTLVSDIKQLIVKYGG